MTEPRDTSGGTQWGLDPELEARALETFAALIDLPPDEREVEVTRRCANEPALRDAVAGLLRDHDNPPDRLARVMHRSGLAPSEGVGVEHIGPYRVTEVIGRGGMGIVYRAEQDRPRRAVAIKVMSASGCSREVAHRFEREVEVLGLLDHPGICRIYGAGTVDLGLGLDAVPYFAMEHIEGEPLNDYAATHGLDVAARCELVAQVCDAAQHAHDRHVVHRDLKSCNILVAAGPDGRPVPRILDFGIARAIQSEEDALAQHTGTGMLLGTLACMSPEQLNGRAGNVDARSDVYSLGALLYELLAGRPPLDLGQLPLAEICKRVARTPPEPLGNVAPELRGDLATIVHKALHKEREDRYPSAAELGADLRRYLAHQPIRARAHTATYQLRKFAQRNRGLVAAVGAVMAVMAAGLVALAMLASSNRTLAVDLLTANDTLSANLYRSQVRLAVEATQQSGGSVRVRTILDELASHDEYSDLRGFEWDLLQANAHRELAEFPTDYAPQSLRWFGGDRLLSIHLRDVVVHDLNTGTELQRYTSDHSPRAPACANRAGDRIVQTMTATSLRVIDTTTGTTLRTIELDEPCGGCAISPDGEWLAAGAERGDLTVYRVGDGAEIARLDGPMANAVTFSDDGRWLAAAVWSRGAALRLWSTADWSAQPRELASGQLPTNLAFDASGERIAASHHDGMVHLWRVTTGEPCGEFAHPDTARGLAFSPDGSRLAVACRDFACHVHDLAAGTTRTLDGHAGLLADVAWSRDGQRLATISDDKTIRLWDPERPPVRRQVQVPVTRRIEYAQLAWRSDSNVLGVQPFGMTAVSWDVAGEELTEGFVVEAGGRSFAWDGTARALVRVGAATTPNTLPIDCEQVRYLAVRSDGRTVAAAAGRHGKLWLWDGVSASAIERHIDSDLRGLAYTFAGDVALVSSHDQISIFYGNTGEPAATRRIPQATLGLATSPASNLLAIGCVDQSVRIFTADDLTGERVLLGHTGHVHALAFSPDGRRLASTGRDRTVRLWDVAATAELGALPIGGLGIAIAFSPDGTRLAALDVQGEVTLWDTRSPTGR